VSSSRPSDRIQCDNQLRFASSTHKSCCLRYGANVALARRAGRRIAGAGDRDRHDLLPDVTCPFIGQIHNITSTAPAPCPRRRPSPTYCSTRSSTIRSPIQQHRAGDVHLSGSDQLRYTLRVIRSRFSSSCLDNRWRLQHDAWLTLRLTVWRDTLGQIVAPTACRRRRRRSD